MSATCVHGMLVGGVCPECEREWNAESFGKPSAFDTQSGGTHYRDMAIQPAEYIHSNGIGYLAGAAIKYCSRYKVKGGKGDLEKAVHCLQMLIELEYPGA